MRSAVLDPSPNRACLSWICTTLQSICPQLTSAGIGSTRPSCPLTRWVGLQGFHLPRVPTWSKSSVSAILSWACALLQSASSLEPPRRHHTLSGPVRRYGSSHEVCSPSAFPRSQQQHDGRVCLTRPLASSGFLDLSTLFISAASLPALFHAGSAHGVAPFRALFPPRGRTPFPAPIPSWCWSLLVSTSTSRSRSCPRRPKPPRTRTAAAFPPGPKLRRAEPPLSISPAPKHHRAERSPDPREPKLLRAGQWLNSPGPKSLRAGQSPELVCAETQPNRASTRSVEAIDRSRPPRRTRRSALCASIRRPPPIGHRPAPRGPEDPR